MKKYALLVAMTVLVASTPARATNGMRMIGFGPSQVAMGGASVAIPLDAASIVTNPAGMSALGGRVDFGASFFDPSVSYRAQEVPGLPQPGMAVASTSKFESSRGASPIPAFGLVVPVNESLWLGIGAYGISGMGVDYPQNLYGGVTYSSYSQMRFAPAIAYKFDGLLSIGVTANIMYATMGYDAAEGLLQVSHQAASSFGIGGTAGILLTPMKGLAFGAAYETKSWFQDFKFNIPSHQPLDPATGRPAVGPNGEPAILAPSVDSIAFDQPSTATVGVAVSLLEPLTLAADVQWIRWSETNGQNSPMYTSDITKTGAMPWNMNWTDQWVFKFGAQYQATKELALRVGYNYAKMPLDPSRAFENIAFPAIAEHHITAGLGIAVTDRFGINLAGMYSPQATLSGSNPQKQYIASYETSMSQFSIDMSIAYRM
jgi:long-chain fatty acid transport protein